MAEYSMHEQFQAFFPDEEWYSLFTSTHLDHLAPKRGSQDDPLPCLEVHYREQGTRKIAAMMLAIDGFNDWDTRMVVMRDIGRKWAEEGWQVLALRLATTAWGKTLTPEEQAARGRRLIETYPDKREIMLVQGLTLDGRCAMASAELLRDNAGRIRAVRPWEIWMAQTQPNLRIESHILNAAFKGYASAMLGGDSTR